MSSEICGDILPALSLNMTYTCLVPVTEEISFQLVVVGNEATAVQSVQVILSLLSRIPEHPEPVPSLQVRFRVTAFVVATAAPLLIKIVPVGGAVSSVVVFEIVTLVTFPILSLNRAYTVLAPSPELSVQVVEVAYDTSEDHVLLSLLNCI